MFKSQCGSRCVLRCSRLNAALVCKRKNAAISQDLVVKAQGLSCRIGFQF